MEFCKNQKDDLSYWEFINSSDAEDGKDQHDDDYGCEDSIYDGFGSWSSLSSIDDDSTKEKSAENDIVVAMVEQVFEPPIKEDDHQEIGKNDDVVDAEEEVYEDEDDGDDMDFYDELVPWMVGDKLGKDRSRKLGKRSCAKWTRSKRISHRGLAYRF